MKGRWFYWLAAELAAALVLAGCAGIGDEDTAESAERHPPVVRAGVRRVPGGRPARPRRADRRRALPELRGAGVDVHLVPERAHGVRLDLQGGAVDPRRQAAQAEDRAGRAQPQAEHLPPDGPARLRGLQGRVGVRRVPAGHLPWRAHAPARSARRASPEADVRRASTSGSGRSVAAAGSRLLLPARADAARAVALSAVGPPEPPDGQRPGRRASTSCPGSTTRTCRSTTTCATCCRWATPTT